MAFRRQFRLALAIGAAGLIGLLGGVSPGNAEDLFCLTLLHNNDGESQLIDAGSGIEDFGGAARFRTVVRSLQREAVRQRSIDGDRCRRSAFLMLSSGDNYLAGPEFNVSLTSGTFLDAVAIRLIGYDALAIGNHEFDFGPDVLEEFITDYQATGRGRSSAPFLSSNLDFSNEPGLDALVDAGSIASSRVIRKGGQKIGIIGATTESLAFISSPRNTIINDVATAVQAEVDALLAQGVNTIILISHLQNVEEDVALAGELTGIDIMIAGGGDEVLANAGDLLVPGDAIQGPYPRFATDKNGASIPVVTTAGNYKYVGRLVVGFDTAGNVTVIDEKSGPVRVAGGDNPDAVKADPAIQRLVVNPLVEALAELETQVVAVSEVALDGIRNHVRSRETNLGNLIADAFLQQATQLAPAFGQPAPDVVLQNGGGIRNDDLRPAAAPGNLTQLDTFDILPFLNFVSIVPAVSCDQFKEILENAVSKINNDADPECDADGRFAQIAGFTMVVDATGTAQELDGSGNVTTPGTRVQTATLADGREIVAGGAVVGSCTPVNIATIDFLAKGGDQYPFRGAPFTTLGVTYQQALLNYLQRPAAEGALEGLVTAAQYPAAGEGRTTINGCTPLP